MQTLYLVVTWLKTNCIKNAPAGLESYQNMYSSRDLGAGCGNIDQTQITFV